MKRDVTSPASDGVSQTLKPGSRVSRRHQFVGSYLTISMTVWEPPSITQPIVAAGSFTGCVRGAIIEFSLCGQGRDRGKIYESNPNSDRGPTPE